MRGNRMWMPLTLLALGVLLGLVSMLIDNWYKWIPVSFPIDLRPSISQSPVFIVNLTTDYLIELELERNLPFDQLNCLLGIDTDGCRSMPSPIELRWIVLSSGRNIAEGTSQQQHDAAWSTTVSRAIGRFRAVKGDEYLLQVQCLTDASVLMRTNPRITVRVHPIESKRTYLLAELTQWIGIAAALSALIWLATGILRHRTN